MREFVLHSSWKMLVLICQTYQIFYLQSRVLLMFDIFRWLVILGQPLKFTIDVTEEVLSKFFRRVKDFIHLYFHKVLKMIKYVLKVAFFQISKSQKNIFHKTILSLKFIFPANKTLLLLAGNLNFKLRIVFLEYFFLRFGDLKNELHFLKKKPP